MIRMLNRRCAYLFQGGLIIYTGLINWVLNYHSLTKTGQSKET